MAFSPGGWVCADSMLRKAEVESFLAKMKDVRREVPAFIRERMRHITDAA